MQKRKINDDELLDMIDNQNVPKMAAARHFGVSLTAINKRLKKLKMYDPPGSFKKLTAKKQKFVIGILQEKTQTQAAMDSFEVTSRDSAKVIGSQLISQPDIQMAIEDYKASNAEIMETIGITRPRVFKRLSGIIDSKDNNTSLKGIETAGKFAGWFAPDKVLVTRDFDLESEMIESNKLEEEIRELSEHLALLKAVKVGESEYEAKTD